MITRYLLTQTSFLSCIGHTSSEIAGDMTYANALVSSSQDFEITLKDGKKLFGTSIDRRFGVKSSSGTIIASNTYTQLDSEFSCGMSFFLGVNDAGTIHLYARPNMRRQQSVYNGGLFKDGSANAYPSSTNMITWENFISGWSGASGSGYANSGINFNTVDNSCRLAWYDRVSGSSATSFYVLYPITVYDTANLRIDDIVDPSVIVDSLDYFVTVNLNGCTAVQENPTTIGKFATSTLFKFYPETDKYFDINSISIEGDGYPSGNTILYSWLPANGVLHVGRVSSDVVINVVAYSTPYSGGGESEPGYGEPTYDVTSVNVPYQESPDLGALNSGFVTLYTPKMSDVQNLARYMWAGSFDINNFKKLFSDPMDAILGFSILPLTSTELGAVPDTIYVGNLPTPIDCDRVTRQYVTINCGNISLKGTWGAYLDYSPYTKLQLYLPYIGFVELNPDDCMNRIISIRYSVDVYSGACLAQVYVSRFEETETEEIEIGSVLYEFSGNCASWYPINAGQYQNGIAAIFNAAIGIGTAGLQIAGGIGEIKSGNVAQGISIAASGVKNGVSSLVDNVSSMMKPVIQRSGGPGGSSFMMGHQYPYLIITIPRMIIPGKQNEMIGYPSYVTCHLAELNGFTSVESIHIKGIEATREEIDEIYELLKNGVFL